MASKKQNTTSQQVIPDKSTNLSKYYVNKFSLPIRLLSSSSSASSSPSAHMTLTRCVKLFSILCFIIITGQFIFSFYPIGNVTFYIIRMILLKVRYVWDWSYVNQNRCLLYNSKSNIINNQPSILIKQQKYGKTDYNTPSTITYRSVFQCYSCQDLIQIRRLILSPNFRDQASIEDHILNRIPFIVSHTNNNSNSDNYSNNPINSWPILSNHQPPIEILSKIYLNINGEDDVCMFASNIQIFSPNQLLSKLNQHPKWLPWFAQWENCLSVNKKAVRRLYKRPEFIPSFIELTHSNWIVISGNNYTAKTWKLIDLIKSTKIGIFVQIIGSNRIKLLPKADCYRFGCDPIETTVKPFDFLFYSSIVWTLSYLPSNSSFNLAFILGGSHEAN